MDSQQSRTARARGALVGAAVGDAVGAPYEGADPDYELTLDVLLEVETTLRYTDDGHMLIGLAESLIERGGFDAAHLAGHFASRYAEEPWRGYGRGSRQVLGDMVRGVHWEQAAAAVFEGRGSFGNGGAMRVAPAGVLAAPDLDRAAELARDTTRITHVHHLGIEGAVIQAVAVAFLLDAEPGDELLSLRLMSAVRRFVKTDAFHSKLNGVERLLESSDMDAVVQRLGTGIAAHESVPTALFAFLRHPGSFGDAVALAVSLGGDADTIASMAGALSGAYLGYDAIPHEWREAIEDHDLLVSLADRLISR